MILHYVLGQAGSGKSTFIGQRFPKDDHIVFNVGEILRGTFSCMKNKQTSKNVWSFANPIVYSMFKHCCKVCRDHDVPMVSDGMPRNSKQLMVAHRYLTDFSHKMNVEINVHLLHVGKQEQIDRIESRNGSIDPYQLERIDQSRADFDNNISALGSLKEDENRHHIKYKMLWYKQEDGGFSLERSV